MKTITLELTEQEAQQLINLMNKDTLDPHTGGLGVSRTWLPIADKIIAAANAPAPKERTVKPKTK